MPVQEVVRRALNAVSRDKARVIPGTLVNLAMTTVVFLPMFLKRLDPQRSGGARKGRIPVAGSSGL